MDERENYCKLLGLNPFRAKEYDDVEIGKAILDAEHQWQKDSKVSNQTSKVQAYRANEYLKMIPDMRSTMDSPILRRSEFDDAKKLLMKKASKLRRYAIILPDGGIVLPPSSINDFLSKIGWANIDSKSIVTASGLKVINRRAVNDATTTAYRMLSDVGADTPHELINRIISIPQLELRTERVDEDCEPDQLRMAYEDVIKRLTNTRNRQIPNLDTYINAVRAVKGCSSDESLVRLINYGNCMKVLKPVFENFDEDCGTPFSRSYIDDKLTRYVNNSGVDEELCIELMVDYCIKKRYPANFSLDDSTLGSCPRCNATIFANSQDLFCPCCGGAINEVCPCSGTAQTAANQKCVGCGESLIPALGEVRELEKAVRDSITAGSIDKAVAGLGDLESRYPAYKPVAELKKTVKESGQRLNRIVDNIISDFMGKNFFAVKRDAENGSVEFPSLLTREDVAPRYAEACSRFRTADDLCVRAVSSDSDTAKELYIKASEVCPDHPDAVTKLMNYPPEGPADGECQSDADGIELKFAIPEERRGMVFCIYRNEGAYPDVDQTTRPLAEIEGWTYTDYSAEPGVEYYYRIYSKRWGILSQEYAECGPALIVREVTNARVEPAEDGLRITYTAPRGSARVRVWRKESGSEAGNGDEDEILHNDTGVIMDNGLQGGSTYYYLLVAEYDVNGSTERSYGNLFSGTTAELPAPIDDLSVRWDRRRNCYVAKWSGDRNAILYYSNSKDSIPGEHVSIKDLESIMTRIDPLDPDEEDFTFLLPEAPVTYICPAITVGGTTVRGKECVVANLRPFRNLTRLVEDSTCTLRMDWPIEAEFAEVTVIGKNEEGGNTRDIYEVSRDDYDLKDGVRFELSGALDTAVSVSAVYVIDGVKQKSIGLVSEIHKGGYSKVGYSLKTDSVKGERRKTRIDAVISCPGESIVPRCVMVVCDEGIPLRKDDGRQIWESDDPVVLSDGTAHVSFVIDSDDAVLERMRLFFPDRSDYNKYRFVHPVYRRK